MERPYNTREMEFLARLRSWSRTARDGLKQMEREGFLTREAAAFVAMSIDDALLVSAVAVHMNTKGEAEATCSQAERQRMLVDGLLKPP